MYISVNSLLLLSKCLLRGNRALINGGVAVLQTSATIVTESVHYENTSPTGGCYTLFLGAFNATSSQFFRNGGSTVIDGGVLYSNAGGFIHTKNNTFSDNKVQTFFLFTQLKAVTL